MENDFYRLQIWRPIRSQRQKAHELINRNRIPKETWVDYLKNIYGKEHSESDPNNPQIITDDNLVISKKDVKVALKKLKNRKSPGVDGITNELLKYGGESIIEQLLILINKILQSHKIPDEWRISRTVLLFKKGDKGVPSN